VNSGIRIQTDRATFNGWVTAMSDLALPAELRSESLDPERFGHPGEPSSLAAELVESAQRSGSARTERRPGAIPPVVAAALALHDCAEVAVTLWVVRPTDTLFGCFGLVDDLAAGLIRHGEEMEVGLFDLTELVGQVIRLVPVEPRDQDTSVRITVMGADAAVAGWQQILTNRENIWYRTSFDQVSESTPVLDLHQELAADLRFALADCLAGGEDV
jgi:hypothetical protein